MPFAKGSSGNPKGRRKGAVNKTTGMAKDAIALAAEKLGGVNRLVKWAQEDPANERVFWGSIYTKLLPLQIGGDPDNPIEVVSKIERVIVGASAEDAADPDAEGVPTAH